LTGRSRREGEPHFGARRLGQRKCIDFHQVPPDYSRPPPQGEPHFPPSGKCRGCDWGSWEGGREADGRGERRTGEGTCEQRAGRTGREGGVPSPVPSFVSRGAATSFRPSRCTLVGARIARRYLTVSRAPFTAALAANRSALISRPLAPQKRRRDQVAIVRPMTTTARGRRFSKRHFPAGPFLSLASSPLLPLSRSVPFFLSIDRINVAG